MRKLTKKKWSQQPISEYMGKRDFKFLSESNAIEDVHDSDSFQKAVDAWKFLRVQPELTIPVILETHKILMQNQPLRPDEIGFFRKRPVWIAGREGVDSERIEDHIREWLLDVKTTLDVKTSRAETALNIRRDHVTYEKIHPFIDGNGRTGRLFLNWERVHVGLPVLVIKAKERYKYYEWFKNDETDLIREALKYTL